MNRNVISKMLIVIFTVVVCFGVSGCGGKKQPAEPVKAEEKKVESAEESKGEVKEEAKEEAREESKEKTK